MNKIDLIDIFGDTLISIYKKKIKELKDNLYDVYLAIDLSTDEFNTFNLINTKIQIENKIDELGRLYRMAKSRKEPLKWSILPVEEAKQVSIYDLHEFKRKGKMVSCPFHGEDKKPSMSIKDNKYNCFACGKKGDSIQFIMDLYGMSFVDAVKKINGMKNEAK